MGACVSSQQGALETKRLTSMQKAAFDSVKEPETPQSGRILSGSQVSVGHGTSEAMKEERAGPSPLSMAPLEMDLPSTHEAPYGAPYIPLPGVPPPESPQGSLRKAWQPSRQRAVLVGCNYVHDAQAQLKGCVQDAASFKTLLKSNFGYETKDIILLQDEQPHPDFLPTKDNIMRALRWLVKDSKPSDSLVFVFSGRSAQASPGEELQTGSSEGLLPIDYAQAGVLSDLDLNEALVSPLEAGVRLHCFIDAAPFGLSVGLPYVAFLRQDCWPAWEEGGAEILAQRKASLCKQRGSLAPAFRGTQGGEVIIFSNAADEHTEEAQPFSQHLSLGAITFSLRQAIEQQQGQTYYTLLRACWLALKNGPVHFVKVPEVTSSHQFDLKRDFVL